MAETAQQRRRSPPRTRMDVDFQQEMRQKLDAQAQQLQDMALTVQDIRARQTPRSDIEMMMATRVSLDVYTMFRTDAIQRLERLERAPDAERANLRANIGIIIAFGSFAVTLIALVIQHWH